MNNITDKKQSDKKISSSITSIGIIAAQQFLKQQNYGRLPPDFIEFLHRNNGIVHNGGVICGIDINKNNYDISTLNKSIVHPLHKDLAFLGYDDFDYLAYNQKYNVYQIIDKDDFEVLEEYTDFTTAAQYILKTDND